MEKSMPYVYPRADGFVESQAGDLAVVMLVSSGKTVNGIKRFYFRPSMTTPVITVEWKADDLLALFDKNVATSLLRAGYARIPVEEEIEWANELYKDLVSETKSEPSKKSAKAAKADETPKTDEKKTPLTAAIAAAHAEADAEAAADAEAEAAVAKAEEERLEAEAAAAAKAKADQEAAALKAAEDEAAAAKAEKDKPKEADKLKLPFDKKE